MGAGGTSSNPPEEYLKRELLKEKERKEMQVSIDHEFQRLIDRMAKESLYRTIKVESDLCDALIELHKDINP